MQTVTLPHILGPLTVILESLPVLILPDCFYDKINKLSSISVRKVRQYPTASYTFSTQRVYFVLSLMK
jgi:hypothetical protein